MIRRNLKYLKSRMVEYCNNQELFVQNCYAGADPSCRFPAQIITDTAWQSLFAYNMFRHADDPAQMNSNLSSLYWLQPGLKLNPKLMELPLMLLLRSIQDKNWLSYQEHDMQVRSRSVYLPS